MTTSESLAVLLESSALVTPVTALEFLGDDYLLTGEGPILSVFDLLASPRQCASLNILHNYRIHGIRLLQQNENHSDITALEQAPLPEGVTVAVFGGKGIRLIKFRPCRSVLEVASPLLDLQDWVLDVTWLTEGSRPLLGVSLAHNSALLLESETGNVLALCSCVDACLLYSAILVGSSWEDSVLVGGTVFNQLVLWKPGGKGISGQAQVERRLLGHKGVIFSLCYLQSSGWLASASDDRSVRVWNVGKLGREGGCGEVSPMCLRVLYGHQARVFCVRLFPGWVFSAGEDGACLLWDWGQDGRVGCSLKGHRSGGIRALAVSKECAGKRGCWVATGGADGGIRLWRMVEGHDKENEQKDGATPVDLRFTGQGSPKVVRSVGGQGSVLVCTDQGEVFLHQHGEWEPVWKGGPEFQSYCVMEVACICFQDSDEDVWVCAVGSLNGGVQVFVLEQPSSGVFLHAGQGKVHSLQWVEVMDAGKNRLCLLASGSDGMVHRWFVEVLKSNIGLSLRSENLKPFLLPPCAKRWLTAAVTVPHDKRLLWVCGDRRGSLLLYRDEEVGKSLRGRDGSQDFEEESRHEHRGETENESDFIAALSPISTLFGVHGKQGVTSVCEHLGVCYSTGRDGCVRVFVINGESLNVRRVHRACKGMEWLEKVFFLDSNELGLQEGNWKTKGNNNDVGDDERIIKRLLECEETDEHERCETEDLERNRQEVCRNDSVAESHFVIAGFHSVQFVLWDPLRREKLFSVTCGGGHRSWAFISASDPQMHQSSHTLRQGSLIFIKQGAVMASCSLSSTRADMRGHTLKDGLHGRGLGCVCRLGSISRGGIQSQNWEVLVTGGEDTLVTILAIQPELCTVKVLALIADHISNVRTLATSQVSKGGESESSSSTSFSTLLFSAGGRAQLQCYRILIGWDEQLNVPLCQVTQIAGHRLDEQWEKRRNRHKTVKMDPETRYMSMAVVHENTEEVLLALACSDGAVRLFTVMESSRKAELLWESFYHQRCVLSVASCSLEDEQGKRHVLLFSGATDGDVVLWDLTAALDSKSRDSWHGPTAPFFSVHVHQSGVNTLVLPQHHSAHPTGQVDIVLASGGDDGQLSVIKIRVQLSHMEAGNVLPKLLSHWSVPLAHSAPLTSLSALYPRLLISASPDQRLSVWRLSEDGLHHQGTTFSHTADAAGLWAWYRAGSGRGGRAYVVVCGQGLQLLKLTEGGKDKEGLTKGGEERRKVMFAAEHFVRL